MQCGYVPNGFKCNYIVPVPKVKDCRTKSLTCDDFRGIAISPILSKVFEHCFLDRFKEYLNSADNQFGFKKGVSCGFAVYDKLSISLLVMDILLTCALLISLRRLIKSTTMVYS